MALKTVTAGEDHLSGEDNENNFFLVCPALLSPQDTITGVASINFIDALILTCSGTVTAAQLAGVTGIEVLQYHPGGNSVFLSNQLIATSDLGFLVVVGGGGNDVADASSVTNGGRVLFFAGAGTDTFLGGNGNDYIEFNAAELTSADSVSGGSGFDALAIGTSGALAASALANVTGIDALILHQNGSSVTLTDAFLSGADAGVMVVVGGDGADTVDASGITNGIRTVFLAGAGNDTFIGGNGGDYVAIAANELTAADHISGGANFDIIEFTSPGAVSADAFANVSSVDVLYLTLAGNTIALGGAMVANSDAGVFVVHDEAGHNSVDASAATLGGRLYFNAVAGDHNTYTGGTGSDFFDFRAANLNDSDTLAGGNGAGTDFLRVVTAASVTAADLANVTQMEVVQLLAGGSITLADTLSNTGRLEADGSAAADTIDGSGVSSFNLLIKGAGGADTLKGGGENDQFFLPDTNFVTVDGNGGFDKIVLTSGFDGQTFDLTAQVSKIADVEAITLENAAGAIISLGPDDIAQINPSGNFLYVVGGSDDQIDVNGSDWTQLETDHINPNLPGHTFVHFQHLNGSDLYVDILFPLAILV